MNFRAIISFSSVLLLISCFAYGLPGREYVSNPEEGHYSDSTDYYRLPDWLPALPALARPIIVPTYFLTSAQKQYLRQKHALGRHPVTNIEFNIKGPVFESLYDVQLKSSQYRLGRSKHLEIAKRQLAEAAQTDERVRALYTTDEWKLAQKIMKNGGPDGQLPTPNNTVWHHSTMKKGGLQLVDREKHLRTHHSVGGYLKWAKEPTSETYRLIGIRWSYFAITDFSVSMAINTFTGKLDQDLAVRTFSGVIFGWSSASVAESLLIRYVPASIGGPATFVGSMAYLTSRMLAERCLSKYHEIQLFKQEMYCLAAEKKARWQALEDMITANEKEIASWPVNMYSQQLQDNEAE